MESTPKLRLDKWLWHARFFKSRAKAGEAAGSGHTRVNGSHVSKSSHGVRPGDVLTFAQGRTIRVIRIEALGTRRGPAVEAAELYTDLAPPESPEPDTEQGREAGSGRPTKRERREIEKLRRFPS